MKVPLSDQAYERIRTEILTCELEPGQHFAQQQLVTKYNVGKTPIREALQRLTQDGFVQPVPRFGYVVAPIMLSDVHEIYDLRAIVEPAAARLAAIRGTDEQLERIREAADKTYVYSERETYLAYLDHNRGFHCSIAVAAGNRRLANLISKLLDELARVFHLGIEERDKSEEMRRGHMALVEALIEREPDLAEEILLRQIEQSREGFLHTLTQHLGANSNAAQIQLPYRK